MSSTLSTTRAAALAAAAFIAVLLAGCGAGQSGAGGDQTAGLAPEATVAPTPPLIVDPTEAPGEPGTELPEGAPVSYPSTARAYAEATVAAWADDDLDGLAGFTTEQVHEQFIEIPGQLKTDWIYVRCDGVAGSSYCTLRNGDGDQVRLKVVHQYLGGPHAVTELTASLTVYKTDAEDYAREFVFAWKAGNTPRMRALARPDVVVAVNNLDVPAGNHLLLFQLEHGGAGLVMVHVSAGVTFRLDIGTTLLGQPKAIVGYGA
jgi:hypothetical protein